MGTPLALLDGLVGDDPEVVSTDGDHTTYAAQVSVLAYVNATSSFGSGAAPAPPLHVRWTIDAEDRPVAVVEREHGGDGGIRFSDWGSAPPVEAPEGAVTWDELIERLTGGTV